MIEKKYFCTLISNKIRNKYKYGKVSLLRFIKVFFFPEKGSIVEWLRLILKCDGVLIYIDDENIYFFSVIYFFPLKYMYTFLQLTLSWQNYNVSDWYN